MSTEGINSCKHHLSLGWTEAQPATCKHSKPPSPWLLFKSFLKFSPSLNATELYSFQNSNLWPYVEILHQMQNVLMLKIFIFLWGHCHQIYNESTGSSVHQLPSAAESALRLLCSLFQPTAEHLVSFTGGH